MKLLLLISSLFIVLHIHPSTGTDLKITISDVLNRIGDINEIQKLNFSEKRKAFLKLILENEDLSELAVKEANELGFTKRKLWLNDEFPCENYTIPGSGKDVNSLTPLDIKVIAALGDSLSAGLGIDADTIFGVLLENRGKVFDIGGLPNAQTLVNLFKVYNPNIKGFSTETTFIRSKGEALNVAVSGATSVDLIDQVDLLVKKMNEDFSIDMKNDWKLINVFIGNNDICRSCEPGNAEKFTAEKFKERIYTALDRMKAEIPKAFVNLITMLEVYRIYYLNQGLICSAIHLYECPCVAFTSNLTQLIKVTADFQAAVTEITEGGRYDDKDDFTVVTQPFFENTYVPMIKNKPDMSYFAPDCFHLSEKGHAQTALSLWNSLFESIPTKRRDWYVGETFKCPSTESPFFATKKNSV